MPFELLSKRKWKWMTNVRKIDVKHLFLSAHRVIFLRQLMQTYCIVGVDWRENKAQWSHQHSMLSLEFCFSVQTNLDHRRVRWRLWKALPHALRSSGDPQKMMAAPPSRITCWNASRLAAIHGTKSERFLAFPPIRIKMLTTGESTATGCEQLLRRASVRWWWQMTSWQAL